MEFTTDKNRPVIINPENVVAVAPAYDKDELPVVGVCTIVTNIPPPNIPHAGNVTINVKGDYRRVAAGLGFGIELYVDPEPGEDDDIPF